MLMPFDITTQPGRLMLGVVYDRLYKFFKEYDSRAAHDTIVQSILTKLINEPNTIKLLLKIEDNQVVGHILMAVEHDLGVPIVTVHQVESDSGMAKKEEEDTWLEYVQAFGQQHNATRIVLVTRRHPKVFERRYGFKVHRTLMVKEMPVVPPVSPVHNGHALVERQ